MKILFNTVVMLALTLALVTAVSAQEPRVMVIDGVEYRLFTAEELKPILAKLKERDALLEENKNLDQIVRDTLKKITELEENHAKQIRLITAKLEGERNFWQSQYEAERASSLKLQELYRSCSAKILGLFRICRL